MTTENKDKGFIKIYRSINEWDWWDDLNTFRLFMTILILANWKDKNWRGKKIKRGQLWTSISSLAEESGLTVKQTRSSLDKLIRTNEVTSKGASNGTLITVVNYDFYQDDDKKGTSDKANNRTNRGQTKGKQRANKGQQLKKLKKDKNLKNIVVSESETEKKNFDIWSRLSDDDIDRIYDAYPNTGGILIEEVAAQVREHKREIKSPTSYILGYATRKKWDDNQVLPMPWEV